MDRSAMTSSKGECNRSASVIPKAAMTSRPATLTSAPGSGIASLIVATDEPLPSNRTSNAMVGDLRCRWLACTLPIVM